jgi:hypothetical protein
VDDVHRNPTDVSQRILSLRLLDLVPKLRAAKVLSLFHCSTIDSRLFQLCSTILQLARDNPSPFGGVQVIMFADLTGLAPIVPSISLALLFSSTPVAATPFFACSLFRDLDPALVNLTTVYNRSQPFQDFLLHLGMGHLTRADHLLLDQQAMRPLQPVSIASVVLPPVVITATNSSALKITQAQFSALRGESTSYQRRSGFINTLPNRRPSPDTLLQNFLVAQNSPVNLILKVGMPVILTSSLPDATAGTRGVVVSIPSRAARFHLKPFTDSNNIPKLGVPHRVTLHSWVYGDQ